MDSFVFRPHVGTRARYYAVCFVFIDVQNEQIPDKKSSGVKVC